MYTLLIQAGGRGRRLETFTKNKPKALVSFNSKTLISHMINIFGRNEICKKVVIIVDYKEEVFFKYLPLLKNFHPGVDIQLISSKPSIGTAAGLWKAINTFKINPPILFTWCDLIPNLDANYYLKIIQKLNLMEDKITIFYSEGVKCRWSIKKINNQIKLLEESSSKRGVLGMYYLPNLDLINFYGDSGEFVRGLSENINSNLLNIQSINGFQELGDYENLVSLYRDKNTTRFFNGNKVSQKLCSQKIYF